MHPKAIKCLACTWIGKFLWISKVGNPSVTGQGPKASLLCEVINAAVLNPYFLSLAVQSKKCCKFNPLYVWG